MILGNPQKINLGTSSFEKLRKDNQLFVDKTQFIENFLNEPNDVQLIVRQRRLGKSLNMDMLRCFLTDKEDCKELFRGTYIENSALWNKANSAPVFYFDFKNLNARDYTRQIYKQIDKHISSYIVASSLKGYFKRVYESFVNDYDANTEGLLMLTELVYETTGKRSYILIDEYDKLLTDNYSTEAYSEIKDYETHLLSAGLKGNNYLEKALLTGVMRVSRESMLSGLNNLVTYDLFSDKVFADDFGLTEAEIDSFQEVYHFDKDSIKEWYNGIRINETGLYNIYSVLSYVQNGEYKNYWGRSGTIDIVLSLMNESRQDDIMRLLNGETIKTHISERISLHELALKPADSIYYSLLLQSGYLALNSIDGNNMVTIKIPNKELMNVWKEFILSSFVIQEKTVATLFDNINNMITFDKDVEHFLSDRLSYFDIETCSDKSKISEKTYHVFVLGLLSAYEDISFKKPPLSNRESGDGRYDILFERKEFSIIFEFKSAESASQLETATQDGLRQIDERRYYADAPKDKPLIKTAIAFCGKQCSAKSSLHKW